ncbi:hypothetical protein Y710_16540 [Gordonia sp. QH-12]|uniref:hypothetical protein n=1 Tax=Gordonia TaxID=2053 RepID=UPI0007859020|nr:MULTISPECIES: hypothetical protein [Gordonia]KXT55948.1 hypothetical protein Y710_16540 [Gordonia sp. QH-12]WFN94142.1 hypothetical protein P5P27_06245 [Gordonia sihwensis]WFN94203.1 hypothetical protein P5P27_06555 [Gordonia sihwensis]
MTATEERAEARLKVLLTVNTALAAIATAGFYSLLVLAHGHSLFMLWVYILVLVALSCARIAFVRAHLPKREAH